jgi:hypothetical protein
VQFARKHLLLFLNRDSIYGPHCKTMHRNNVFSEQLLVEGDALVRQYAGEETLKNIMALSEKRSRREEASKHCLLKALSHFCV